MNDKRCGFTNGGPCPNEKKCVFPRCDIEYSGSPVWAALRQVVVFVEREDKKPPDSKGD
jgi:hypothetical protein